MAQQADSAASIDGADASSPDALLKEAVEISEPTSVTPLSFSLLPGDVLAERFVVERLANAGGMGAIYRGLDRDSGSPVAIKVVAKAALGADKRFAREAVVLSELSHPSIVRYLAQGTTAQGTEFIAMEWLDGEDLAARLRRAPLSVAESLLVMRRACEGLALAHARGIVHRDIKPSNLFLVDCEPAGVKVLDFGVARQPDTSRTVTQSGAILGTVGYMSPEQAIGPRDANARADVFALGCVLFECLTGRAAFVGENAVAVLAKLLHEAPPLVTELRPELDDGLAALVASMLAKQPSERPADAAALLKMLDDGLQAPPRRKLRRVRLGLAIAAASGLALASAYALLSPRAKIPTAEVGSERPSPPAVAAAALLRPARLSEAGTGAEPARVAAPAPNGSPSRRDAVESRPGSSAAAARVKVATPSKPPASASAMRVPDAPSAQGAGLIQDVPF